MTTQLLKEATCNKYITPVQKLLYWLFRILVKIHKKPRKGSQLWVGGKDKVGGPKLEFSFKNKIT